MSSLDRSIRIGAVYTRSINIARDAESIDLVRAYLPTSRALQSLRQIAEGLDQGAHSRALALVGPYGSGKSAFGLFASALLSAGKSPLHRAAVEVLGGVDSRLASRFADAVRDGRGFLRVTVSGIPDSPVRQLMLALAIAVDQSGLDRTLVDDVLAAAEIGTPMDSVLKLVARTQDAWARSGGAGVLIELDELGKLLEYESHHPRHREIHLFQLLAEHAHRASPAPLYVVAMLHQAFEHYGQRLGKHLREEWQKVQGRFESVAFLEPAEQTLRVVARAFERDEPLTAPVAAAVDRTAERLSAADALPFGLDQAQARALFDRCYPLHPVTLLILPSLCQKVAQNERTLFSYLGSAEPYGLRESLVRLRQGDWVAPWDLYDYFILNQTCNISDPLAYRRWAEVITALERLDSGPDDPGVRLLKTVGLLNLIGAQRGLKACRPVLGLLFGEALDRLLDRLECASAIHFRRYSQEYRVWQGSDFDLRGALESAAAEHAQQPLVDTLNRLVPLKPLVARRATIFTGTLRCFVPRFVDRDRWPPKPPRDGTLDLWIYLADEGEGLPAGAPAHSVVALCPFTERLNESVAEWMALRDLPARHAELHHDPVARREHRAWLENAELDTGRLLRALLDEPEALCWYWGGREEPLRDRRHLQERLSRWADVQCFPKSPLLRNELINRDRPSPSANLGRKRLLAAMLTAADRPDLGIEKTPAEKSLYLSLLKHSGLHRAVEGRLGFHGPDPDDDPCRLCPLWAAIGERLGGSGEQQVPLTELYNLLARPPYGAKLGTLPVLIVAYLLANPRDVAIYQEGAFCERLSIEQAELLCRRPGLFALERFDLGGLRGELFDRYAGSIVGHVRQDATLLDIVRPLVRYVSGLPEYALNCQELGADAERVRGAFQQARSPGALLFEALPRACGIEPDSFVGGDLGVVEDFIARLVATLRELKAAYPALLARWRRALENALLDGPTADLRALRETLAVRYRGLDRYTPDRMGLGALIRRLDDSAHASDEAWLESVATLLGKQPPAKWRAETERAAELRLHELAERLRDLEKLRLARPNGTEVDGALLLKTVDARRGEISRVLHLSSAQRESAAGKAKQIADALADISEPERFAIVAALVERLTDSATTTGNPRE